MAISDYNKTVWVNGGTPAINETNLNKIETQLEAVTIEIKTGDTASTVNIYKYNTFGGAL
jgi:hypothetical protein